MARAEREEIEIAMSQTMIRNPVLWADVPEVSVIRVGASYYMVSTSMHSTADCPIVGRIRCSRVA